MAAASTRLNARLVPRGWCRCNAPGSVLCRFECSHQIRIITFLGSPPGIMCTLQHTCYVGGIVMIITKVLDGTHKTTFIQQRLTESRVQKIHYKDPNNNGSKIVSDYGQDTNWTKSHKDKRGTITLPRPSRRDSQANVVRLHTCRLHLE